MECAGPGVSTGLPQVPGSPPPPSLCLLPPPQDRGSLRGNQPGLRDRLDFVSVLDSCSVKSNPCWVLTRATKI